MSEWIQYLYIVKQFVKATDTHRKYFIVIAQVGYSSWFDHYLRRIFLFINCFDNVILYVVLPCIFSLLFAWFAWFACQNRWPSINLLVWSLHSEWSVQIILMSTISLLFVFFLFLHRQIGNPTLWSQFIVITLLWMINLKNHELKHGIYHLLLLLNIRALIVLLFDCRFEWVSIIIITLDVTN